MTSATPVVACSDCLMMAANGELGGYDPDGSLAREHADRMAAQWGVPFAGPYTLHHGDDGFFSHAACDTCGDELAGQRFDAAVVTR